MSFHKELAVEKFPRDEHVEIQVVKAVLNADAVKDKQVPVIEIREFIQESGTYGHTLIIPEQTAKCLRVALARVLEVEPTVDEG